MVRTLRHRGPDDEGQVVLPGVGLAMRRLSIIDVAGGHQPLQSEDGAIQLVANGEIYNFKSLRKRLMSRGHHFGRALVHAYEDWGESFLQRVHGMFALALWDSRRRRCCLPEIVRERSLCTTHTRTERCSSRPRSRPCWSATMSTAP